MEKERPQLAGKESFVDRPIPTCHVYDVPVEVMSSCLRLADLSEGFGPRAVPVSRVAVDRLAREVLGVQVGSLDPDPVELLLGETARLGSHQVFILQQSGCVVQGVLLLVPVRNVQGVLDILHEAHLSLCA